MYDVLMIPIIIAGGSGTRMKSILQSSPKILSPIGVNKLIDFQIDCLIKCGFQEILIVAGHGAEYLNDHIDANYSHLNISILVDTELIGTFNAIKLGINNLDDDVLVIYGDLLFDFDFSSLVKTHLATKAVFTSLIHFTDHPNDSDLVKIGSDNVILQIFEKKGPKPIGLYDSFAGIHVISKEIFHIFDSLVKKELESVIPELINLYPNKVYSFRSDHYCKDIGTPARWERANKLVQNKMYGGFHFKIPVIFIDRDGTLIKNVPYLNKIEDIEFLPNAIRGLKILKDFGFYIFVITNQPGIARGDLTYTRLSEIHTFILSSCLSEGVVINGFFFCPHHPDSGFPGEVKSLKISCNCRKPNVGLVNRVLQNFNIDLPNSYVIGDTKSDLRLALNLNCHFLGIKNQEMSLQFNFPSILNVAQNIIDKVPTK